MDNKNENENENENESKQGGDVGNKKKRKSKQGGDVGNKKKRKGKEIAPHGNYKHYYGYRIAEDVEEDPRFKVLRKEWFEGKDCLDIGCNNGLITINIAKKFGCVHILGIDIDSGLIKDAEWQLRKFARMEPGGKIHSEASAVEVVEKTDNSKHGSSSSCNVDKKAAPMDQSPLNGRKLSHMVSFRHENFVKSSHPQPAKCYDTIVCFSVTKWVHLNWGDDGLITLFAKMWRLLHPNGILLLEPQPWSSYGKNRLASETSAANYAHIKLHPNQFQDILLDKIGFRTVENVSSGLRGTKKGFDRPVLAFRK